MSASTRLVLSFVALVACKSGESTPSGQTSAASNSAATPSKPTSPVASTADYDLPDTEPELRALLATSKPARRIAVKGQLRKLAGNAQLSFERTAVVGASLSAGFGGLPLNSAIDKAIEGEHEMISLADLLFYKDAWGTGRNSIDKVLAADATMVFALDILFWYAYTSGSLEQRVSSLEVGLRELERVDVPLILGDIPDMRTGQPWMLPPSVIPPPDQLRVLNERVQAWAHSRLNVHVVPLAEWSAVLASDGTIEVEAGQEPVPAKSLVNFDGLHPNAKGVRYMLLRVDAGLELGFPGTPAEALRF